MPSPRIAVASGLLLLTACPSAAEPSSVQSAPAVATPPAQATPAVAPALAAIEVRGVGLATPESVLHDPERDLYLVTNINGGPLDADDNGFISMVSPEGKLLALKWIDGSRDDVQLDAPKGMALAGDALYVADITQVRCFDRRSGQQRPSIALPGASFVNDLVASPEGAVYASDSGMKAGAAGLEASGTDAIWKIVDGKPSPLVRGPSLGRPNGLTLADGGVVVVTMGSTAVYRLDAAGHRTDLASLPTGSLDGVVRLDDGNLLVSSWQGKKVFRLEPTGRSSTVVDGVPAPADIGLDAKRRRLLIPLFNDDALRFEALPVW